MDEKQTEKIEAYLQGRLTPAEKEAFEKDLEQDSNLQAELKFHQQMVNAIRETEFRKVLGDMRQQKRSQQKTSFKRLRPLVLGIAASILLLVGAFWILSPGKEELLNRELASIDLDPGLPTSLSATSTPEFAEGMNAYKMQNYNRAKNLWTPILSENPENDTLLFYLAQIDLAEKENSAALEKLRQLINIEMNPVFLNKSEWFMAITLLRLGQIEEAKELLLKIQQENGYQAEEAGKWLDYLE